MTLTNEGEEEHQTTNVKDGRPLLKTRITVTLNSMPRPGNDNNDVEQFTMTCSFHQFPGDCRHFPLEFG